MQSEGDYTSLTHADYYFIEQVIRIAGVIRTKEQSTMQFRK